MRWTVSSRRIEKSVLRKPQPAVVLDRQAVLVERDGRIAFQRDAAGADVGADFAARGLDPQAGHVLERLCDADRRLQPQLLLADDGDGVAGLDLLLRLDRAGGDDDFVDRGIGVGECGRGGRERDAGGRGRERIS